MGLVYAPRVTRFIIIICHILILILNEQTWFLIWRTLNVCMNDSLKFWFWVSQHEIDGSWRRNGIVWFWNVGDGGYKENKHLCINLINLKKHILVTDFLIAKSITKVQCYAFSTTLILLRFR